MKTHTNAGTPLVAWPSWPSTWAGSPSYGAVLWCFALACLLSGCYRQHDVPDPPKANAEAVGLFAEAREAAARGDAETATECLDKALESAPDFAQAYVMRGIIRERQQDSRAREDYEQAVTCYERMLQQGPTDPETALDHCVARYLWRGQADALHAVDEMLQAYPGYQPAASLRERIEKNSRGYFINKVIPTPTTERN